MMKRASIKDIAELTGLHPNTIRNWTKKGIIKCNRDLHGWRWFPEPAVTVRRVQGLLDGSIKLEDRAS